MKGEKTKIDDQFDTRLGMSASNIVAIAIIITTAVTLHAAAIPTSSPRPRPQRR